MQKNNWKIAKLNLDIANNFYRLMLLNKKLTYRAVYNAKITINKLNVKILVFT